jgi:RHS repeat-associated protein
MNTYTWNAWSKLASVDMSGTGCSTSGECIIYDAFGRIVEVDSGSIYTETFYTQAGKGVFHGAAKVTGLWPAPGGGIVGDSTAFMHQDWLGSVRLGHTISTSAVTFDQALTPYGEMYARSGSASYGENNFTGDVQAIVSGTSGLWDTPNRELGAPSRWLSPDPAQSGWNPYAYATNPNSMIDPSGLSAKPQCAAAGRVGLRPAGCNGIDPGDPGGPGDAGDGGDGGQDPDDGGDGSANGTVGADWVSSEGGCAYDACVTATPPDACEYNACATTNVTEPGDCGGYDACVDAPFDPVPTSPASPKKQKTNLTEPSPTCKPNPVRGTVDIVATYGTVGNGSNFTSTTDIGAEPGGQCLPNGCYQYTQTNKGTGQTCTETSCASLYRPLMKMDGVVVGVGGDALYFSESCTTIKP